MSAIEPVRVGKGEKVAILLDKLGKCSFGGRKLAEASAIWRTAVREGTLKMMGLGGAMIPAGMGELICQCIEKGYIDILVTTGANLTHDLIFALGGYHEHGSPDVDDVKLKGSGKFRVYDTYVKSEGYQKLEEFCFDAFSKLGEGTMSSVDFLRELGALAPKRCILKVAAENKVPIFCPALGDSILGFQVWMYGQNKKFSVNPLLDQKLLLDKVYDAKKTAALIFGGGVSKNYITQAVQIAERPLSYAVQVTMDRPEHGGVSGASLREAISWGKVSENAKIGEVACDVTIALPLMVAYLEDESK